MPRMLVLGKPRLCELDPRLSAEPGLAPSLGMNANPMRNASTSGNASHPIRTGRLFILGVFDHKKHVVCGVLFCELYTLCAFVFRKHRFSPVLPTRLRFTPSWKWHGFYPGVPCICSACSSQTV